MSTSTSTTEVKWYTFYPCYIHPERTVARGRRLAKSKCPPPKFVSVDHIGRTIQQMGLPTNIETKRAHPQEGYFFNEKTGRVKYCLYSPSHELINPQIKNRNDLIKAVAEKLSKVQAQNAATNSKTTTKPRKKKKKKGKKR